MTGAREGEGERAREARPPQGWEGLTEAERKVAALVAKGMTNEGIAERLFITVATVKTHLSHTFAKLGISKRSELADEVWRRREAGLESGETDEGRRGDS